MFVYYFRRLALMVSSHLAAIIEPKKIAIVTSAQSGKLSITIPGICAPTRPFSSPSGLSPITPPKGRSHTASEPVVRAHHRETLGIANPCRRLPKLRKGDLLLPLPRLAGQERPHMVLRAVVNGAADAAPRPKARTYRSLRNVLIFSAGSAVRADDRL